MIGEESVSISSAIYQLNYHDFCVIQMSDEDKGTNTLRFKKKARHHQSEDNLDQVGDHEAVPLSNMSHAISMPHILDSKENYPKSTSVQNIG